MSRSFLRIHLALCTILERRRREAGAEEEDDVEDLTDSADIAALFGG